jgi:hypothetical protein
MWYPPITIAEISFILVLFVKDKYVPKRELSNCSSHSSRPVRRSGTSVQLEAIRGTEKTWFSAAQRSSLGSISSSSQVIPVPWLSPSSCFGMMVVVTPDAGI